MKNLFNSKPKIAIAIAFVFILLFGLLKPLVNINAPAYFFGMLEKQPKEYVAKGLLKQYFRSEVEKSENGLVFKPFGNFLLNLKQDFNFDNPFISEQEFNQRFWFDNQVMSKVVDRMKFVSCEKGIVHDEVGYRCNFILDDITNTGLYEEMINGRSQTYELSFIVKDSKYQLVDFG
ncbi:hypothetical protein ACO1DV_00945 [Acinetobacter lwoffii]|uniref:hypothetical protein n=1 Tax=Acinetobacter lwoffii TaxID=28090 RepID=UPI003BF725A0